VSPKAVSPVLPSPKAKSPEPTSPKATPSKAPTNKSSPKPPPPKTTKTVFGTAFPKHSRNAPDSYLVVLPSERTTLELLSGTLHLFDVGGSVSVRDTADPKWRGSLHSAGLRTVNGERYYRYTLSAAGNNSRVELLLNRGVIAMLRGADAKPRPAAQLLW
jgi:hypothetical protein